MSKRNVGGAKESKKGVAVVVWSGGSREYSEETHGKEYKALAKEFAEKKGGTVE